MPVLTLSIPGQGQATTKEGNMPEVGEHHTHSYASIELLIRIIKTQNRIRFSTHLFFLVLNLLNIWFTNSV
jgi:hypothetical protein